MEPNPKTQAGRILAHLKTGATLTPLDALHKFGCFRLGARILELRRMGYRIETQYKRLDKQTAVAEYVLLGDDS